MSLWYKFDCWVVSSTVNDIPPLISFCDMMNRLVLSCRWGTKGRTLSKSFNCSIRVTSLRPRGFPFVLCQYLFSCADLLIFNCVFTKQYKMYFATLKLLDHLTVILCYEIISKYFNDVNTINSDTISLITVKKNNVRSYDLF